MRASLFLFVCVEDCKTLFVLLVQGFEHFKAFVVNFLFQLKVGVKRLFCRDKLLYFVKRGDNAQTYADARRRAHRADVLRIVNGFNDVTRDVCKHLASEVGKRTATDESDDVGRFDFPCRRFEHPAFVIANALQHRADKFGFAGFEADVEEHTSRVGVFEWTTVAVKPRREDYAAASCGNVVHD